MKILKVSALSLMLVSALHSKAQEKYITRNGSISIFSATTAENIDANNNEVFSMIDPSKNELAFQVLVTGFKFKKALMQDHFNEDYMESSKFAKASFSGIIADPSKVNFNQDGDYAVTIDGTLTMHGVSNKVTVPATLRVAGKKISADSKFNVKLADYNIKIPALVAKQVSETVAVTVGCLYEPFKR